MRSAIAFYRWKWNNKYYIHDMKRYGLILVFAFQFFTLQSQELVVNFGEPLDYVSGSDAYIEDNGDIYLLTAVDIQTHIHRLNSSFQTIWSIGIDNVRTGRD